VEGFNPFASFGADVAKRYDEDARGDEPETVDFLLALAGDGPVLEFAIGTGRIALPLAERGVRVDGIEQSAAMVERLQAKSGGPDLDVTVGDMSTVTLPGRYPLVYLIFNTIHNLLTQDGQVRCFENAARHLTGEGVFVVETGVPWDGPRKGSYVEVPQVGLDEVRISPHRYDAMTQVLDINHLRLTSSGIHMSPISLRLVYPSELDLMARIAGLQLLHRWGGWRQEPFTISQSQTRQRLRPTPRLNASTPWPRMAGLGDQSA
jgi:SAM-dependent methyltransferase